MRRPCLPATLALATTALIGCVLLGGCTVTPEGLPAQSSATHGGGGASAARVAKEIGAGVFGKPLVIEGTELVLVPYSVVRPESKSKFYADISSALSFSSSSSDGSYSVSASGSGFYRETSGAHWNNLLLYDKRTGDARLLLERRAVIVQAFFPNAPPTDPLQPHVRPHLLLAIAEADTNGDRYINRGDVTVLYHVTLASGSLTPLTPAGAQFDDFTPDEGGRVLYVRSLTDGDGDRQFTGLDDAAIAKVDLASPGPGTPLIPDELRGRAFSVVAGAGR